MDERAESEDEQCYEREYDTDDENNPVNDYPDEEPRYPRGFNQNSDSDDEGKRCILALFLNLSSDI